MELTAKLPKVFKDLERPARYKVLYGGRASMKSWYFSRRLVLRCLEKPTRWLCTRELQKSIEGSVHHVIMRQAKLLGVESQFRPIKNKIYGPNGSELLFSGLRYNAAEIKSMEELHGAWIAEAQTASKASLDYLTPTIREAGSEIWVDFNPDLDTDEVYKRFVLHPPASSIVKEVSYLDNPWLPDVLRQEAEELKARDYDSYENIWLGKTRQTVEGAVYASEIRKANAEGRITRVPYEPGSPVHVWYDLGNADYTAMWFIQQVGYEFRVIDFAQGVGWAVEDIVKELGACQTSGRKRNYVYATQHLPHDGAHKLQAAAGRSIEAQLRDSKLVRGGTEEEIVVIAHGVPRSRAEGIAAVRSVFPRLVIDEAKCADGLTSLRRYAYKVNPENNQRTQEPVHDDWSHAADALRLFAENYQSKAVAKPKREYEVSGWMN